MQTVILGGGISGLTCAFELQRQGVRTLLLERSERVGGVLETVEKDGFLFELGPQSFLSGDSLLELVRQLRMEGELLRGDSRAPRYVLLRGQLHRAPMAPPSLLTTSVLGAGSKLRLFSEPFRKTQPPDGDESVAAFVRRKFGTELLDHLVGPFVSGVYAGDPERLSVRSAFPFLHEWERTYGSVIRGAMKARPPKDKPRPTLCSFRQGVAALPMALHERLGDTVRTGVVLERLHRTKANGSSHFELQIAAADGKSETIVADSIVVAIPSEAAAQILGGLSPRFADLLAQVEYAPVAVVGHGFRREQVRHSLEGFGFLVPRKEGLQLLGTVWNSSLFPGRAPSGMVNLASFVGGATNREVLSQSEDQIAAGVENDLARILGITGKPVTWTVRKYARAIPQYNLGHPELRAGLRKEAERFPGLFLAANYIEGPAIPACVDQAIRTAASVREYLAGPH